ncbi:hypothetical protein VIGAN_07118600, partial [Vigna angularis var. angularis]
FYSSPRNTILEAIPSGFLPWPRFSEWTNPLGFPTFPSPPLLDTNRDRGCRTSLGLPPPAPTLSLPTLDSPIFLF